MDLSTNIYITKKGADEVKNRQFKVGLRKRSVLITLENPRTIEQILHNSVFQKNEILEDIKALFLEGFIDIEGEKLPASSASISNSSAAPQKNYLENEIIISEAKFLLTDFCVDSFGTQSQAYVDEIHTCHDVDSIRACLNKIFSLTEKHFPDLLPKLHAVVGEINKTA